MTRELSLRNRQRACPVDGRGLRRLILRLLEEELRVPAFELGIHLVGAAEMTRLNETFLRHAGSTDVITFDYSDPPGDDRLHGEIYVCTDEALAQARRFRTTWPAELARYIIHGVLHLRGFDDRAPARRQKMKREENRLLRALAADFQRLSLGSP